MGCVNPFIVKNMCLFKLKWQQKRLNTPQRLTLCIVSFYNNDSFGESYSWGSANDTSTQPCALDHIGRYKYPPCAASRQKSPHFPPMFFGNSLFFGLITPINFMQDFLRLISELFSVI